MAIILLVPSILAIILPIIPTIILANFIWRLFSSQGLPKRLPWAGVGGYATPIARARANLASFFNLQVLLDEGYNQYSKNNRPYVLPYFINGHQVILPRSQTQWLLEQPDSILSQERVNRQFLVEAEYTFFHANLVKDPVHIKVVKHELTKLLDTFTQEIVEETQESLQDLWGGDTDNWHEVKLYDTMLDLMARLSTRVFIGQPLCREPDFLKTCRLFDRNVALSAAALNILPRFMKPLLAPFVTCYDYRQYRKCSRYILPIIKERLERIHRTNSLPAFDPKPPNDYIQWAIDHALRRSVLSPNELDPRVISCRFLVLCFAAIQSSVITLTNCLFDIAATTKCESTCNRMRQEVVNETTEAGWSKSSLARMRHIDSSLRESLRLNGFIERGIMKMVVAPGGVALPDGSRIPYGTKVGISGYSLHHDDDIYDNAKTFEAFRFAGSKKTEGPLALVTTSDKFMGFSHGSHACPGRFFAANQLKIALAHIVLHYEIEPIPQRPVNQWFFGHIAPPLHDTIRVRRRKI